MSRWFHEWINNRQKMKDRWIKVDKWRADGWRTHKQLKKNTWTERWMWNYRPVHDG